MEPTFRIQRFGDCLMNKKMGGKAYGGGKKMSGKPTGRKTMVAKMKMRMKKRKA